MVRSVAARSVVVIAIVTAALFGTAIAASAQPVIKSVTFSGVGGPGTTSPQITVNGGRFKTAPPGTPDDVTTCGTFSGNGDVFGPKFYFVDDGQFEAGYGGTNHANCLGLIVKSWGPRQIVFTFGSAYGQQSKWHLTNGDGFAISIRGAIWGGVISGLT